jgi:hypothetical protein
VTESKKSFLKQALQNDYIAYSNEHDFMLNLFGIYEYMASPYFISQELETSGYEVHPTCKEMLDGYITPILLEKAHISSIPIPTYYISNGYFEPPVIIDPINPFMIKSRTVLRPNHIEKTARSMTRNYTYAVCCQELPAGATIQRFRSVLGWCANRRFRDMSTLVWETFRIPLAKVRVIIKSDGEILLSDISYLPLGDLNEKEINYLSEKVRWEK